MGQGLERALWRRQGEGVTHPKCSTITSGSPCQLLVHPQGKNCVNAVARADTVRVLQEKSSVEARTGLCAALTRHDPRWLRPLVPAADAPAAATVKASTAPLALLLWPPRKVCPSGKCCLLPMRAHTGPPPLSNPVPPCCVPCRAPCPVRSHLTPHRTRASPSSPPPPFCLPSSLCCCSRTHLEELLVRQHGQAGSATALVCLRGQQEAER